MAAHKLDKERFARPVCVVVRAVDEVAASLAESVVHLRASPLAEPQPHSSPKVMRGLDDLVRQGKVLYVGISDAPAWWIAQANTLADQRGWSRFIGLQIEYSLIGRLSAN
jgi:aryl-alcohol dehydrogenase-like predicted oxidoreductase